MFFLPFRVTPIQKGSRVWKSRKWREFYLEIGRSPWYFLRIRGIKINYSLFISVSVFTSKPMHKCKFPSGRLGSHKVTQFSTQYCRKFFYGWSKFFINALILDQQKPMIKSMTWVSSGNCMRGAISPANLWNLSESLTFYLKIGWNVRLFKRFCKKNEKLRNDHLNIVAYMRNFPRVLRNLFYI